LSFREIPSEKEDGADENRENTNERGEKVRKDYGRIGAAKKKKI